MNVRLWSWLLALMVIVVTVLAVGAAWRAQMSDRAQLASELAATKQALQAADARQQDRDAKLAATLEQIAAEKRTVQSPAQIVKNLPALMDLPVAITLRDSLQPAPGATTAAAHIRTALPGAPNPNGLGVLIPAAKGSAANGSGGEAVIPSENLKPLYDFALDCQACQAKLTAAQSNLTDEQLKSKALTKERDDALRVARGGSILRRIVSASKWMLIGAAAGAVAARMAH
jgi:type II secretory pathway pseudopilin PulG